ncbi:MAG: hypothetical protein JJ913_05450 [Rhizobiaceae bacterium]|nr:hypothetical protein [Rhizobiaceae bacterium]
MSDERMARPVSGEIMTDGQRSGERAGAQRENAPDIIDADFETIIPATGQASPAREAPAADPSRQAGMDMLRDGGGSGGSTRRRGGPAFWIVGMAIVFGAFWVSGGHAIVSQNEGARAPSAPAVSDRQPLRIINVVSRIDRRDDRAFLLVDGEVVNDGMARAALPPLAITVTGINGRETRYFLGTNEKVLAPGERFAFSSRLHAPNEGVSTVTVDFRKESDG